MEEIEHKRNLKIIEIDETKESIQNHCILFSLC